MIQFSLVAIFLVLASSPCKLLYAAEDFEGTPAEKELIALLDSIEEQYNVFWQACSELQEDPEKYVEFRKTNDPAQECAPALLAFEEHHRGTLAGLMALRRIVQMAGRGSRADNPSALAKREVLDRLSNYVDRPELLILLAHLGDGTFEPRVKETLRTITEEESASPLVREYSQVALGRWMLNARDSHGILERRLQALNESVMPTSLIALQAMKDRLAAIPADVLTEAWQKEAVELLREVADSTQELFLPEVKSIDPHRHLLVLYEDPGKMRRLSDSAKASLFKENHLRLGSTAPELEVELLSGENWSMDEQRDKAIIIQFAHKTCSPCVAMYPDFRELQQQYGEQLSILSVMSDRERTDAEQSVADGDVSWNVHWEGSRGPIGNLWAVNSYPTVYVVDPQGKIAGVSLRGEQLKKKIGELLN